VKTQLQETVNNPKVSTNAQPKMVKTQGTYTYHTGTGPHSDTSVSISSILEDKHGNIWVATMGEGVYRYDGIAFKNFTVKDSLLTNVIYSILEDKDGNIWFGTTDGATRYNGKSFTNFPFSVIKGPLHASISIKYQRFT
jgi:ligand-binding sensor domain-containing protein